MFMFFGYVQIGEGIVEIDEFESTHDFEKGFGNA
jgi:hypothetical protein